MFSVAEERNVCRHRRSRSVLEECLSVNFELTTTVPEEKVAALVCEGQKNDERSKHVLAMGCILMCFEKRAFA